MAIIKNRDALAKTSLRKQALDIIEAGINRVLPPNVIRSTVSYDPTRQVLTVSGDSYHLSRSRVFVIGGGKASGLMAETLESILLPAKITAGIINVKSADANTRRIRLITAGHPIPDERGINGVKEMLALKQRYTIGESDLVLCLISGGGSALMPYPASGVSLKDKRKITELLISSGAEIAEINTVRKHLSQVKGGQLGAYFAPTRVVSLILSDVIGNDLSVIASGPTSPDPTTFADAHKILEQHQLLTKAPRSVASFLEQGGQGKVAETPKTLNNCHNYIIGDNRLALEAMKNKAQEMGFTPYIITAQQSGDTTTAAQSRAEEILGARYAGYDALLIGGETTPKLPTPAGRGGRNQHFATASILAMAPYPGEWVVASVGSDGSDFLPEVAGAIVDHNSLGKAKKEKIDVKAYLDRYDSNTLLEQLGGSLIITGATGTNVGDIMLYLFRTSL
ncbi:MAG: DUF4147 domain-containing protein [Dehalococcoidia bacterium]|nr:MAG: DUF4147 domain-containing protein [Dehalococcoidia bacterium]